MATGTETPLLTKEIRAWIGKSYPPRTGVVTARDIRKFCIATGNRDPRFLEGANPVAPPGFAGVATSNLDTLDKLKPDGLPGESFLPKLPLPRIMAGGVEAEYKGVIRAGDTLTAVTRIHAIQERKGRTGPLIFTTLKTTVTNQRNEEVIVERTTLIAR